MVVNALNTVSRVDVLYQSNLVAGSTTRAGDDGGVGQEEFPDLGDTVSMRQLTRCVEL